MPLSRLTLVLLCCAGCATVRRARAYQPTTEALTPTARQALTKGMNAVDPLAAVGFFEEARTASPRAPEVYFDLAVAESRLPGRELRAMAWFGAYLAAAPRAGNAQAVKDEIAALAVKGQKKTALLLERMRFIARHVIASEASGDHKRVALLEVKMGDLAAARKTLEAVSGSNRDEGLDALAEAFAADGDVRGALEVSKDIDSGGYRAMATLAIARAHLRQGDTRAASAAFAAARKDEKYQGDTSIVDVRVAFAIAQSHAGDTSAARDTIAPLAAVVNGMSEGDALVKLAAAKAILDGDLVGTLARAPPEDRDRLGRDCAEFVAKAGRVDLARQLAGRVVDPEWQDAALGAIARMQADAGDIAGAQQTLGPIANSWTLRSIAEAQLKKGDPVGARANLLASRAAARANPRAESQAYELVSTAQTQLKAGDGLEAARTLDQAEDACGRIPWNEEHGFHSEGSDRTNAQAAVAEATRMLGRSEGPAFEFLELLRRKLVGPVFLDLDRVILAPPPSGNPQKDFEALEETAKQLIEGQRAVEALITAAGGIGRRTAGIVPGGLRVGTSLPPSPGRPARGTP